MRENVQSLRGTHYQRIGEHDVPEYERCSLERLDYATSPDGDCLIGRLAISAEVCPKSDVQSRKGRIDDHVTIGRKTVTF